MPERRIYPHIRDVDDQIKDLYADLKPTNPFWPTNLPEERQRFLEAWHGKGASYNPTFEYDPIPTAFQTFKELLEGWIRGDSAMDVLFQAFRDRWLTRMMRWEAMGSESQEFEGGSQATELVEAFVPKAKSALAWKMPEDTSFSWLGVKIFRQRTLAHLQNRRIKGWAVQESREALDHMEIDVLAHKIFIQSGLLLTEHEIDRLLSTLIDIHVLRSRNAERQKYQFLRMGLLGDDESDIAMTLHFEHHLGFLTAEVLKIYAGRFVAAFHRDKSFWEIFSLLSKHLSVDQAFQTTVRAKLGLRNTSKPSPMGTEHLYFQYSLDLPKLYRRELTLMFACRLGQPLLNALQTSIEEGAVVEPVFLPPNLPVSFGESNSQGVA